MAHNKLRETYHNDLPTDLTPFSGSPHENQSVSENVSKPFSLTDLYKSWLIGEIVVYTEN